jgi:hypothetical protein
VYCQPDNRRKHLARTNRKRLADTANITPLIEDLDEIRTTRHTREAKLAVLIPPRRGDDPPVRYVSEPQPCGGNRLVVSVDHIPDDRCRT